MKPITAGDVGEKGTIHDERCLCNQNETPITFWGQVPICKLMVAHFISLHLIISNY